MSKSKMSTIEEDLEEFLEVYGLVDYTDWDASEILEVGFRAGRISGYENALTALKGE